MHRLLRLLILLAPVMAWGQAARPKIIDAHIHHNGEISFLRKLAARLRAADAMGLLITAPKDLDSVKSFMEQNPNRLAGLGEIRLDDPNAVELVDRFHAAGFPGLGELTRPLRRYDDRSYWPIYARAEQHRMIVLFHTGIVNRTSPDVPEDVSIDRMRPTTLDLIARRFPKLTIIGAHLGNPEYAPAAEVARWSPNLYFDLSGSTLIKKSPDYTFFNTVFWWSAVASPHTPKSKTHAFEKVVFGSDIFGGEIEEFDRTLANYQKMLNACGVPAEAQANIMGGTVWRILRAQRQ
jgi:predicted TIM-barrel fold metal-dependent hydrolase